MNYLKMSIALLLFGTACTTPNKAEFEGHWIEVMPANPQIIQGVTLNADGSANSIGMATLKYEQWSESNNQLVLKGKSIGNGQTLDFADTLDVISLTADSMTLGKYGAYRISYYRVNDPNQVEPFHVLDSLKKETNLGKLMTRVYENTLPAASSSGIEYTVTLYNYEHSGDGVYQVILNYLEAENGQDKRVEKVGRMYTLRGDAENKDATVYQLIPFYGGEGMNFLYLGNKLELLTKQLQRLESPLNYTLNLRP